MDHVLTTQELGRMIEEAGLRFMKLQPESFDMPMGFKTGAGVIFGNSRRRERSGAALRRGEGHRQETGQSGFPRRCAARTACASCEMPVDGTAEAGMVHGLKNARTLAEKVRRGKCDLDLIEVMACPGGCIGGAGQPVIARPGHPHAAHQGPV